MINVKIPHNSITADIDSKAHSVDNSKVKLVKGDKGAVFTPAVDELSNLSWSNDGGLPNPPTVNIRGRDGSAVVEKISNYEIEKIMEG